MHQETLKAVVDELRELLPGPFLGRVIQVSPAALALDFQLRHSGFLFVGAEPASPRLYLFKRTARELEQLSFSPSPFLLAMRATLQGARVLDVSKDDTERVVRFKFSTEGEDFERPVASMVAQLTGRSANLFLLDAAGTILHALRRPQGVGQQLNEQYQPPPQSASGAVPEKIIERGSFQTVSEAVDEYYRGVDRETEFKTAANKLKDKLAREIKKQEKLRANLTQDLADHGNADDHKRLGDLLWANIGTAERSEDKVTIQDYFAEGQPAIQVIVDKDKSLQDAAAEAFSRYGKAKRAVEEIKGRLSEIDQRLDELKAKQVKLDHAIASGDAALLSKFASPGADKATKRKEKPKQRIPGTRSYLSSDGYEVLVGRAARDNDNLTFRIARPNDLWMHAGDYPGSHVIVRNPRRTEVPQRTVIEAAQLAARFSQASNDAKVTIHYTPRKFLSKPKGSAPGLVRMSTFKSITVEPGENIERML